MTYEFTLPDVGEGVAEGEVVRWLVEVGDAVEEDQPVVEVETDKALVEIPSPVDGRVAERRAEAGEVVPVGDVLVTFEVEGEAPAEPDAGRSGDATTAESAGTPGPGSDAAAGRSEHPAGGDGARTFATPNVRRVARELGVDLAAVSGSGPGGRVTESDVRATADGEGSAEQIGAGAAPAGGEGGASTDDGSTGVASASTSSGPPAERDRTLAVPATRRVARELGVDIDAVPAVEEREGEAFVTEEAVRSFAASREAGDAVEAEAAGGRAGQVPSAGPAAAGTGERETREPYRGLRRTIGEAMVESASEIPHVHAFETVEVSRLVETRERLRPRAEEQGIDLTYLPLVVKALVATLREYPSLNASLDEDAGEIVYRHYYNVGIAVHTEAGLMVPVVEDAGDKGLLELASEISALADRARDRSISREEMQGGTVTVTNYGAVGGELGTPIINPPEVAVLGLGRIEERPVVEDGEVVARPTLPLSLGIDHRVIDGGTAAAFRNRLREYLREPSLLLLER